MANENKQLEKLVKMNALIALGFKREDGEGLNGDIHLVYDDKGKYGNQKSTIEVILHNN